jgi:hypothetical protein
MTNKQNINNNRLNKVLVMIIKVFEQRYSKRQARTVSRFFGEANETS